MNDFRSINLQKLLLQFSLIYAALSNGNTLALELQPALITRDKLENTTLRICRSGLHLDVDVCPTLLMSGCINFIFIS